MNIVVLHAQNTPRGAVYHASTWPAPTKCCWLAPHLVEGGCPSRSSNSLIHCLMSRFLASLSFLMSDRFILPSPSPAPPIAETLSPGVGSPLGVRARGSASAGTVSLPAERDAIFASISLNSRYIGRTTSLSLRWRPDVRTKLSSSEFLVTVVHSAHHAGG